MRIYTKAELVVKTDDDQFADLYGVSVSVYVYYKIFLNWRLLQFMGLCPVTK